MIPEGLHNIEGVRLEAELAECAARGWTRATKQTRLRKIKRRLMVMVCVGDSVTMILDVSTRYLSDTATLGYYDDLLPFHLSPPTDLSPFHGPNEMSLTYGDDDFYPSSKPLIISPRLSPGAARSSRPPIVTTNDKHSQNSRTKQSLGISDPRASNFHRSASVADLQAGKRMQNLGPSCTGLRRIPRSTHDLRSYADQQDQTALKGQHPQTRTPQNSYLQHWLPLPSDQTEYEQRRIRRKFQYQSYQDLHILSMYQENGSMLSLNSIRQPQSATIESTSEASESTESSPQSSPRPQTPSDTHFPFPPSWNNDRKADEERSRRIDARQVHVIEHDLEVDECKNEIKQATVLIGPGKPRLIQIHRPIRPCNSPEIEHHNNLETITPVHSTNDRMALFSPPITPLSRDNRLGDFPPTRGTGKQMLIARKPIKQTVVTTPIMHNPIVSTPVRKLSVSSGSTVLSLNDHVELCSPDLFGDRCSQASTTQSCNTSILDVGSPGPTRPSTEMRQIHTKQMQQSCDRPYQREMHYESLISAITSTDKALDALAGCDFDLASPVLTSFRQNSQSTKGYNTSDYILIAHLNRIFSQSSLSSLSVLAAWLLVDAHYVNLFSSAPSILGNDSDLWNDQENSPTQNASQRLPRITVSAATSPTMSSRPRPRKLISTPLYASSIPSKARSILGIPTSNPVNQRTQHIPVRRDSQMSHASTPNIGYSSKSSPSPSDLCRAEGKARIVHASVQVVGRKLVADLLAEKDKGARSRGKPGIGTKKGRNGTVDGPVADDVAVNALWEACRCVASLE